MFKNSKPNIVSLNNIYFSSSIQSFSSFYHHAIDVYLSILTND